MSRIPPKHLRRLRNEIDVSALIQNHLHIPSKFREDFLRFLCPLCNEFNAATNPRTNLARCFRCKRNFNPIDLVMVFRQCAFLEAVRYLQRLIRPSI